MADSRPSTVSDSAVAESSGSVCNCSDIDFRNDPRTAARPTPPLVGDSQACSGSDTAKPRSRSRGICTASSEVRARLEQIDLRGFSASAIGRQFVAYVVGVGSLNDANKAMEMLSEAGDRDNGFPRTKCNGCAGPASQLPRACPV